jgi:hypothetical protein
MSKDFDKCWQIKGKKIYAMPTWAINLFYFFSQNSEIFFYDFLSVQIINTYVCFTVCMLNKFENNKVIVNINYFLIRPHSSCSLAMKLGIKY